MHIELLWYARPAASIATHQDVQPADLATQSQPSMLHASAEKRQARSFAKRTRLAMHLLPCHLTCKRGCNQCSCAINRNSLGCCQQGSGLFVHSIVIHSNMIAIMLYRFESDVRLLNGLSKHGFRHAHRGVTSMQAVARLRKQVRRNQ